MTAAPRSPIATRPATGADAPDDPRNDTIGSPSRRRLVQAALGLGGGLLLPLGTPLGAAAAAPGGATPAEPTAGPAASAAVELNDWIWIAPNGDTVIGLSQCEAGQGVYTGLPQVLADELDADWRRVGVRFVTGKDAYRSSAAYEPLQQFVGASMSVTMFYDRLRLAGAQARDLLARAGAQRLGVRSSQCETREGRVVHVASGRSIGYGEVAGEAAKLPLNPRPHLKPPSAFTLIGRDLPRLDTPAKVDGSARFGIDVQLPGMLYGAVRIAPSFTGKVLGVRNETAIRARPGVVAVVVTSQWPKPTPNTVIVVADSFWTAQQAAAALDLEIDPGPGAAVSSATIERQCAAALAAPQAVVARSTGDVDAIFATPGLRIVEAEYRTPYLTHATMEPMCATADVRGDTVEVWGPIQGQDMVREWVHKLHQVPEANVIVNTTFLGGSFGRKYVPDFVLHAVAASKAVGRPVKVIRTRDQDTQHGYYRPNAAARYRAALGADGLPLALSARVVGHSLYGAIKPQKMAANGGWDETMVEALYDLVYRVPNLRVEATDVKQPIPVSFMRTVGSSSGVFFLESFVSEMAEAAGEDDHAYRRRLLAGNEAALAVLDRAAALAGWAQPPAAGVSRAMSFNTYTGRGEEFQSHVAMVVELRVEAGEPKVTRIVCAVDCGRPINPGLIRANVEGGIGFGLTNAWKSAITFANGAVEQSNFHDYPLLTIAEMPPIEVAIIASDRPPQGCGELSVSPVAPALATALHRATGRRFRAMPFNLDLRAADVPASGRPAA